jgi:hypothetical protein
MRACNRAVTDEAGDADALRLPARRAAQLTPVLPPDVKSDQATAARDERKAAAAAAAREPRRRPLQPVVLAGRAAGELMDSAENVLASAPLVRRSARRKRRRVRGACRGWLRASGRR